MRSSSPAVQSPLVVPAPPRAHLVLAFVTISLVWGSTYLAIADALDAFGPFAIGALRFLAAGGVLYAVLRARGEAAPTARQWGAAALTGTLYFVLGNGLVNVAERSVASGVVSVLVATMPLWATVFAALAGERATRWDATGLALGIAGVVVMNLGGELRASSLGAVCALVAPMCWALGTVVSRRVALPRGAMCTASQMLAGGAQLAVLSAVTGERLPASPPASAVLAVAYLALFGSLIGFSAYTLLVRHTRASVATSYAYVNPVIAIALGVAVRHEHLDTAAIAGAVIILAAVLLLTRARARARGR